MTRRACALVQSLADQREIELEIVELDGKASLRADPDQLQQAITNLVLNAIHASSCKRPSARGVGEVDASDAGDGEQDFVTISVHDAGSGIPDELRGRIFEPFFTTKPAGEGTGLGLSVVKDIIEEHGGFVEVVSGSGGSVFTVHLPRSASNVG